MATGTPVAAGGSDPLAALKAAKVYERITAADGELWWALAGLDKVSGRVVLAAEGDSGVEGLKAFLRSDLVQFFILKVLGVDKKGDVVSTRMKIVVGQWTGDSVRGKQLTKAGGVKPALLSYMQGAHLELAIHDKASLTEGDIERRLRAAGGAHQPSDMVFGRGSTTKMVAGFPPVGEPRLVAADDMTTTVPFPAGWEIGSPLPPGTFLVYDEPAPVPQPKPAPAPAPAPVPAPAAGPVDDAARAAALEARVAKLEAMVAKLAAKAGL